MPADWAPKAPSGTDVVRFVSCLAKSVENAEGPTDGAGRRTGRAATDPDGEAQASEAKQDKQWARSKVKRKPAKQNKEESMNL